MLIEEITWGMRCNGIKSRTNRALGLQACSMHA